MLLAFGALEITFCVIAGLILIGLIIFFCILPTKEFFTAVFSEAYIPAGKLISMKNRGVNITEVLTAYVDSKKAGLNLTVDEIESHIQNGGSIDKIIRALLLAKQSKISLDIETAKAIDKSGENLLQVLNNAIVPMVMPFTNVIGVSQDNYEVIVSGKVTLKTNLKKFLGGVQEETLIARVVNEIVNLINECEYSSMVVENPSVISDVIRGKNLSQNAAYDIVSLDITNVRIGENLNMKKYREDIEKRKLNIELETERMKQSEIIEELQAKTRAQEAKIELINQEKEFAKSLFEAVEKGNMEALEYFKIKNLQADTEMRTLIAHPEMKNKEDFDDESGFFDDDED